MERKDKLCIAIFSLCVILSACGHEPTASAKAITNSKNAMNVGQEYLDGSMTADDAVDSLNDILSNLEYASNYSMDERDADPKKHADYDLYTYVFFLNNSILIDRGITGDAETFDKVQDNLDQLKEKIDKYD